LTALAPAARAWVERSIGAGARVVRTATLPSSSCTVLALTVEDRRGGRRRHVLRLVTDRAWVQREPDLAAREAATLTLLESSAVPAPRLVAVDATGSDAGAPAVLSTWLPGRPPLDPGDAARWLPAIADAAAAVHEVAPAPGWRRYRRWFDERPYEPPPWTARPSLWDRAVAVTSGPVPAFEPRFVHRDFHSGNVLWRGGRVTGVVDWIEACVGPAAVDAAHCRVNLHDLGGFDLADRLPMAHDPYRDVVDCLDLLSYGGGEMARGAEPFLERALAELGRP
jgi:aminoglycoside phosphotransferase (APT) family kinase protein